MKNKKILKRLITLFCAAVLLIGGIAIFATSSKAKTVAEQLAEDGYTRISPEDFGVTEEKIYTVDGTNVTSINQAHKSSTITSIDNKYFEADLSITPANNTNANTFCYWQRKLFRVYVSTTTLYVFSQTASKVIVQRPITDFNITSASEYFNFKIATKVTDNATNSTKSDIAVKVWINNIEAKLTNSTITVGDDYVTNLSSTQYPQRIRVDMQQTGTVKIRPAMEKTEDISDTLKGYTKMETTDFGISEEVMHSAASTSQVYAATNINSFHERYLDADISFEGGQGSGDAALCYMGQEMFRMYISSNTFYIYDYQNSTTLYEKSISELGISEGEYFHLKWATSINAHSNDSTKSNVSMKIWINDAVVAPLSATSDTNSTLATVNTATLAQNMTVLTGDASTATIKIKPTGWETVVDPNLPAELVGYKKVTPENFGINEEFVYDTVEPLYTGEGLSKWADVTDFNHTYFNADLALTDTQATNVNAGFGYLNKWMFRFYISGTTLVVYTLQDSIGVLYQVNLSDFEITAGEYFNLKFATDITDNTGDSSKSDVKVQMWLNNKLATPTKDAFTIDDAYATSNYINMTLAEEGTIKIRPAFVEETEDPENPEEPSDPLQGFIKITPETFGITEEVVNTYVDSTVDKAYSGTTSVLDKNSYFEADVSLSAMGMDTGYIAYLNKYLLRIYVAGTDITVYSPEAGKALFQTKLSSLEGTVGEYFHLKFATSMKDNASNSSNTDITVQMWVNDYQLQPLSTGSNKITVGDAYACGTNLYVGLSTAGTIKIKPHIDETEEPEEPDVPVVPEEPVDPNLPEELKDYTKVTPQYFGIKKPAVHVYGTNSSGTYTGNGTKSFEKTYFEADIALPKASLETGYIAYLNQYLFRFYMTSTTFVVYSPAGGGVVYQENLSAIGIKSGEYFNLKFATDMVDNVSNSANTDVTVQIWINDTKVKPDVATVTVTDGHANGQSLFVKLTEAGTIKVKTHVEVLAGEGERLSDVTYELSSTSGYLLTGSGDLFVDGVSRDVGTVLTKPGDYVIQNVVSPDEIYIQNVSLYKVGDVNLGGGFDWTSDDQGELKRILKYGTTSNAAKKAADINNDGKVTKSDLTLIKKVVKGDLAKSKVMEKYHTPAVTYDFLGGDSVMPIGGYHGPYNAQNITEDMYKAIAESGINLIVKSEMDYANEDTRALLEKGLKYAEKYKIGVFVYDTRLNPITASNGVVTEHNYISDAARLATLLGDYSKYQSFLGNMIVDEPIANQKDGWKLWAENRIDRYKWYEGITTTLNAYDNQTGYVNLLGQYHMQQQEGYVYMEYDSYLRTIGKSNKLLSFDSYPFWEKAGASGGIAPYLKSLGTISKVAREDGYPFWSYIQAGTDYRDDSSDGATTGYLTKAQTLWNVNTSLAFGAKGIVYFPLVQPTYFANVEASSGTYDYNRNGIFGADNKKNDYYAMVQEANEQVAAVDEVLMKSLNQGVIVTGQAKTDATGVENIITSTDRLRSVTGDDAMVGCFTYKDTEAFYIVSYDYVATEDQTITLNFDRNSQYRIIQNGQTNYGEGSSCTIKASAGEGALVVLEDHIVYYEDISSYRAESGYTAPEAPEGYLFAGWYKDKACTKENAVKKGETDVAAYAKFVDEKLLTVKAQITAGTTADSTSTNIRFITSINDKNYIRNGFKINIHKESGVDMRDYSDNIVYKKLSVKVDADTTEHTPQELFCATATFFKAQIINNVPKASFDTEFEVTPYWETLDGTIVYGNTTIKTVRQGIQ